MYNSGKIILGIIIFAALFTAPLWMNLSGEKAYLVPDIVYPVNSEECIYEKEYMRAYHMDILDEWRDKVVREDIRFTEIKGERMEMSLSKTCMKCHVTKEEFCDRCHEYLGVTPYCWECHIMPLEVNEVEFEKGVTDEMPDDNDEDHEHNGESHDHVHDSDKEVH